MTEPKPLVGKKEHRDVTSKQVFAENATFSHMSDDVFPTGPSLKSATRAEDALILSDDETKTLTTLEPVKKPPKMVSKKSVPAAVTAAVRKHSNEPRTLKDTFISQSDVLATLKSQKSPDSELPSRESLIQKMRSKLNKHIELKPIPHALDMSGVIEIPTDLILSNDIPHTPLPPDESKESKLEDHDLIAILEGNVVAIREKESEIEVCVGSDESKDIGAEMEILSFSIVDSDELQQAKKEREKEIARQQMESLPLLPKVRKPRTKIVARTNKEQTSMPKLPVQVARHSPQKSIEISLKEPGVTIKGQTTIRPVVKVPSVSSEKAGKHVNAPSVIVTKLHNKLAKEGTSTVEGTTVKQHWPVKSEVASPQKTLELIDSLVSDWDDEPSSGLPEAKNSPGFESLQSVELETFALPSPVAEPKRVIKRKIIWDPSNANVPFASLVKSNRTQSSSSGDTIESPVPSLRRRRADSVAVRMIDDTPRFRTIASVPQRAKTPEPPKFVAAVSPEPPKKHDSLPLDSKAKKRKKNEIERLLGDEGAINMLYDVECETNRKDLLKDKDVDTSDEDEMLIAKTKIITDAVINQGKSPTESAATQGLRVRAKRAATPSNQLDVSQKPTASPPTSATVVVKKTAANGAVVSNTSGVMAVSGARRRKNTTFVSKDWDYVYNAQRNEDAMIIRRRSNSSYSSGASPRRLSLDQTNEQSTLSNNSTTTSPNVGKKSGQPNVPKKGDGFSFAKPPDKSDHQLPHTKPPGTEEIRVDSSLVANMRGKLSQVLKGLKGFPSTTSTPAQVSQPNATKQQPLKRKAAPKITTPPDAVEDVPGNEKEPKRQKEADFNPASPLKMNHLKQMTCVRHGDYVEIVLKSKGSSTGEGTKGTLMNVFTSELLSELSNTLSLLQKDVSVRAVLLRSAGAHFSRGLDVGHLVQPIEKRKSIAEDMSICLMNFWRVFISFSKPIVAAVHGDVLGMGVTILPVCDMVIAQMGSNFTAPYGHFGYLPEGLGAFTGCRSLKSKTATDLFLLGKRITASVALEYGLITETVASERFDERAHALLKIIASQSVQAMQSIKLHQRRELLARMESVLAAEQKRHAQQWPTVECQQKFKAFVSKGGEL